ncbi:MAG: metallophosphoesterase [Desulfobacterales bacterium]|nr:metallophosphoesterase [Desulfobacterales bacterium]
MKIAVISDIHGNLEAFRQVLADIDSSGTDTVISLGDNIGYGPDSEQVIRLIRERNIPSVMGNHEWAVADTGNMDWFNPVARLSLQKTMSMMSDESLDFVCNMKSSISFFESRFVHGFPPDMINTYVFQVSNHRMKKIFRWLNERICFVGHTHLMGIISFDGRIIKHALLEKGITELSEHKKYIINTGSVGQPRDGNNNAKYVIWDTSANNIEARFIPYNIAAVAEKIVALGLPRAHADRLW